MGENEREINVGLHKTKKAGEIWENAWQFPDLFEWCWTNKIN